MRYHDVFSDVATGKYLLLLSPVERLLHPRESELLAFGKLVVAQLKVLLAIGEKNYIKWVTRSVTHQEMREQSLTTIVQTNGRALARTFAMAMGERMLIFVHVPNFLSRNPS